MKNTLFLLLIGLPSVLWGQQSTNIIVETQGDGHFKQAVFLLADAEGISNLKRKNPYISFSFSSEEARLAAMATLQSNSIVIKREDGFPVDFPVLSSRPTQEELNTYAEQKQNWVANNPLRYQEMIQGAQQNAPIIVITVEEFNSLPIEKQQYILDHPNRYTIEE